MAAKKKPVVTIHSIDYPKSIISGLDQIGIGVVLVGPELKIIYVNQAFTHITGYSVDESIGQLYDFFYRLKENAKTIETISNAIQNKQLFSGDLACRHKDGSTVWISMGTAPHFDDQGQFIHFFNTIENISFRKQLEIEALKNSLYDPLTNLPNRRLFEDRMHQIMLSGKKNQSYSALFFIDLDKFKPCNDEFGHLAGDLLLKEVSKRLSSSIRASDTVSRFGGDEFVILLSEISQNRQEALKMARRFGEKIVRRLGEPYCLTLKNIDNSDQLITCHCTASIGGILFVDEESQLSAVLQNADELMYKSKHAGGNQLTFSDAQRPSGNPNSNTGSCDLR